MIINENISEFLYYIEIYFMFTEEPLHCVIDDVKTLARAILEQSDESDDNLSNVENHTRSLDAE